MGHVCIAQTTCTTSNQNSLLHVLPTIPSQSHYAWNLLTIMELTGDMPFESSVDVYQCHSFEKPRNLAKMITKIWSIHSFVLKMSIAIAICICHWIIILCMFTC